MGLPCVLHDLFTARQGSHNNSLRLHNPSRALPCLRASMSMSTSQECTLHRMLEMIEGSFKCETTAKLEEQRGPMMAISQMRNEEWAAQWCDEGGKDLRVP